LRAAVFETTKDLDNVYCRADISKGGTFNFYINNIININQPLFKERVILITRVEPDDRTLKKLS